MNKILIILGILIISSLVCLNGCIESNNNTSSSNNTNPDQTSTINVSINGENLVLKLSRPVNLPINENDAIFINYESGCICATNLSIEGDYWVGSCCDEYPDCSIIISIETGDVTCEHYG